MLIQWSGDSLKEECDAVRENYMHQYPQVYLFLRIKTSDK